MTGLVIALPLFVSVIYASVHAMFAAIVIYGCLTVFVSIATWRMASYFWVAIDDESVLTVALPWSVKTYVLDQTWEFEARKGIRRWGSPRLRQGSLRVSLIPLFPARSVWGGPNRHFQEVVTQIEAACT